jgi:hypothetical protein
MMEHLTYGIRKYDGQVLSEWAYAHLAIKEAKKVAKFTGKPVEIVTILRTTEIRLYKEIPAP